MRKEILVVRLLGETMSDLTILLPTKNEVEAIGKVIDEIRLHCRDSRILVVDGKSTDGTLEMVIGKNIDIDVFVGEGNGKGSDVKLALPLIKTPYVVMVNADYTYPAIYIQTIYNLLKMNYYDVVTGCRQLKEKGSMSSANTFGNFFLSLLASILYRYRINDVCSGMWGFRREVLNTFDITSRGFTLEADLFTNSVKHKCRICQIPIEYRKRLGGSKPKLTILDGLEIPHKMVEGLRI